MLLAAKGTAPLDATQYDTVNAAKATSCTCGHHVLEAFDVAPCVPTTTVSQNVSDCLSVAETKSLPNSKYGMQLRMRLWLFLRTLAQEPPIQFFFPELVDPQ